jgi:hypothetical protein
MIAIILFCPCGDVIHHAHGAMNCAPRIIDAEQGEKILANRAQDFGQIVAGPQKLR